MTEGTFWFFNDFFYVSGRRGLHTTGVVRKKKIEPGQYVFKPIQWVTPEWKPKKRAKFGKKLKSKCCARKNKVNKKSKRKTNE